MGRRAGRALAIAAGAAAIAACGGGGGGGPAPVFPADYAASYTEVRGCRKSADHNLNNIVVLADAQAMAAYLGRDRDFPVGAVVIKEEYDFADLGCTGAVVRWTAMVRLETGGSPATLDWRWQDVEADRAVISEDDSLCYGCHAGCGIPPDGYQGTCAVP